MNPALILVACLVLLISLLIKEALRQNKAWLAGRILASSLAVASLAGLILPVKSPFAVQRSQGTAVLIAEGANDDSISHYKKYARFYLSGTSAIPDLGHFLETSRYTKFHLIGYGATKAQLELLKKRTVWFHASPIPAGFTAVSWNRELRKGGELSIRGTYNNPGKKDVKLVLKGLETGIDSVTLSAKKNGSFLLKQIPKLQGKNVYQLLALSGKDTLNQELIPFEVTESRSLKVLILSGSPDFENKFLKNWLFEQGFFVAVRSAISRGKTSTEFLNMRREDLGHLKASQLDTYDLVLSGRSYLNTLNKSEAGAISSAVKNGLGLLIRADSLEKRRNSLPGNFSLYTVPLHNGVFIRSQPGSQAFMEDDRDRILAAASLYGSGKTALFTLPDTYNIRLSGDDERYSRLWTLLLEKTARTHRSPIQFMQQNIFATVSDPQRINVQLAMGDPRGITFGKRVLPPVQDIADISTWHLDLPPAGPGWQQAELRGKRAFSWYVFPGNSWKAVRAAEMMQLTRTVISEKQDYNAGSASEKVRLPISKVFFLLIFLFSCAFMGRAQIFITIV